MITGKYPSLRLRRSRKYDWTRRLIRENDLSTNDLILPIFLTEGKNKQIKVPSMPGVYRYSINLIPKIIDKALSPEPAATLTLLGAVPRRGEPTPASQR